MENKLKLLQLLQSSFVMAVSSSTEMKCHKSERVALIFICENLKTSSFLRGLHV